MLEYFKLGVGFISGFFSERDKIGVGFTYLEIILICIIFIFNQLSHYLKGKLSCVATFGLVYTV